MKLTFKALSETKVIRIAHPVDFIAKGAYTERKHILNERWGKFVINELWFEGICICYIDAKLKDSCNITLHSDAPYWMMNFMLEGSVYVQIGDEKILELTEGQYHTTNNPILFTDIFYERSAQIFLIWLTPKFINKLVNEDAMKNMLVNNGSYRHTRQYTLIKEILETDQQDYLRRIAIESKVLELLYIQLQQAEISRTSTNGFNRQDIERLNDAKAYIDQNIQTPCSLIELARKTGLNDFKLKKGFKALFGNTVFGYLFDLRMDMAYRLLQKDIRVSEVAETIGYKNPHHFTAAFKKKFGFLPSQVNKVKV